MMKVYVLAGLFFMIFFIAPIAMMIIGNRRAVKGINEEVEKW